ncbi:hypothetical protein BDZ91DRAFT_467201 [Kalaharituber pfeilii]|nr:hypothetical protein BDZ91DRAFT_467201 [Kalaharituber pfeilii]
MGLYERASRAQVPAGDKSESFRRRFGTWTRREPRLTLRVCRHRCKNQRWELTLSSRRMRPLAASGRALRGISKAIPGHKCSSRHDGGSVAAQNAQCYQIYTVSVREGEYKRVYFAPGDRSRRLKMTISGRRKRRKFITCQRPRAHLQCRRSRPSDDGDRRRVEPQADDREDESRKSGDEASGSRGRNCGCASTGSFSSPKGSKLHSNHNKSSQTQTDLF